MVMAMKGEVIRLRPTNVTMNMADDGSFHCMACGSWTEFEGSTKWAEHNNKGSYYFHMHGSEEFRFCPNCGAEVLSMEEWVNRFPYDAGNTKSKIHAEYARQWKAREGDDGD